MAPPVSSSRCDSPSFKIALALALLRFNKLHRPSASSPASESNVQRWKRKAKDRKREILRLREELKQIEDRSSCDVDPPLASCRCYFFDGVGELGVDAQGSGEHWIDEVLRRRFLRLVRWKEGKKKVDRTIQRKHFLEYSKDDEMQRLGTSIDFLVELTDSQVVKGEVAPSFATFSHQAVDFILATLKNLISLQKDAVLVEEIINNLITCLVRKMCSTPENAVSGSASTNSHSDVQFCIQHLIRKLGNEPFVGQRTLLLISQKISGVSESLLFIDPFDESFPCTHGSMFLMIQLVEFLIADYVRNWMVAEDFETKLFEEWVRSILQAQRALEVLECRIGLYALYMERVTGELAKLLAPLASQGKLDKDIASKLFC